MIIYSGSLGQFRGEAQGNTIAYTVQDRMIATLGRRFSPSELSALINSLQFMNNAAVASEIPEDCGVLIEFVLPLNSKRIDFLVTGTDSSGAENAVLVELKQWSSAEATEYPDLVRTYVGGGMREVAHPSYQVAAYRAFLTHFLEAFHSGEIQSHACAYLHNYVSTDANPLLDSRYGRWLQEAPLFFSRDHLKLAAFLRQHLKNGKGGETLYRIENSRVRPSKKLIDHVDSLFRGNDEFVLLDEQKVAFERAKAIATASTKGKNVVIVHGGAGTGKSVLSMNLLRESIKAGLNAAFVAPSAPFRTAVQAKLCRGRSATLARHLFKGSGSFLDCPPDSYDCLIIDEAHRLSGPKYQYFGENQVQDIINAGRTTIFFIDDNQQLRKSDIGSTAEIRRLAQLAGATIDEFSLSAQFRCGGADGYMSWLHECWAMEDSKSSSGWADSEFDFRIFDSPNGLWSAIRAKQKDGYAARLLAGYAWPWTPAAINPNGEVADVAIPEHDFEMPWNSRSASTRWFFDPKGDRQVGCIYTSQGLEFDYVGVLVGNDIEFDPETQEWRTNWKNYHDRAGKANLSERPEELRQYISNIYKVLMSRGLKGCYVFFRDKPTEHYFRRRLEAARKS